MQEAIETPRFRLSAAPNFYKPGCPVSMSLESRVPAGAFLNFLSPKKHLPGSFFKNVKKRATTQNIKQISITPHIK